MLREFRPDQLAMLTILIADSIQECYLSYVNVHETVFCGTMTYVKK